MTPLYVLDEGGAPVAAPTPEAYGQGLLDPRRQVGFDLLATRSGSVTIQTQFVGVDFDGTGRLWQTTVEWSDMQGASRSDARWANAEEAAQAHADLLVALQAAVAALVAAA